MAHRRWILLILGLGLTFLTSLWSVYAGGGGVKYAFLVACAEYDKTQLHPLPYTIDDVEGFKKALLATGFDADHIVVLHDRMPQTRYRPSKNSILKELRLLLTGMRAEDLVVVALSGHGLHYKGDKTGYFCPVDARLDDKATLIPMDTPDGLFAILKSCKARQKLLIVNACRNDPTTNIGLAANKIQLDDEDSDVVPEGIAAIYSCKQGQKSYYDPERKLSLFYDHLIRAWKGTYQKDGGKVRLEHVLDQVVVKTKVDANKTLGALQVPEVRREYKGEWVIADIKARAIDLLFPLEGVILGKTTVDELSRLGRRDPKDMNKGQYFVVQGINFWHHEKNVAYNMYLAKGIYQMPTPWQKLGFDYARSYNGWLELFANLGWEVAVLQPPKVVKHAFLPHNSLNAEIQVTSGPIQLKLRFDFGKETTAAADTLYSLDVKSQ